MLKNFFILIGMAVSLTLYAAKGQCGNDLFWLLKNDTLTIAGNGEMFHYWDYASKRPDFEQYKDCIKHVVIQEGVSTIGTYAFYHYDSIKSVDLPSSLKKIYEYAFQRCASLREVILPDGLEEISGTLGRKPSSPWGDECHNQGSFSWCTSLEKLTVGKNLRVMNVASFFGCENLRDIDWNAIDCFLEPACDPISEGTDRFRSNRSFEGTGIVTVNFGDEVRVVPEEVFLGVKTLSKVNTSGTIEYVKYNAFMGTNWFESQPSGMVYVDKCAYRYKPYPVSEERHPIVIREGTTGMTFDPFRLETDLQASDSCATISKIVFPSSMRNVGKLLCNNFSICPETIEWNCKEIEWVLPDVRNDELGNWYDGQVTPFANFTTDFVLGDEVRMIPEGLLCGVTTTKGLKLPSNLERIEGWWSMNVHGVEELQLPHTLKYIGEYAFSGSSISCLEIPSWTDESSGMYALVNADNLQHLIIGENVSVPVDLSNIPHLEIVDWNAVEVSPYEKDYYYRWKNPTQNLTINFGSSVKSIPDNFMYQAPIELHLNFKGTNLRRIGSCAFYKANKLLSVTLPDGLEEICEMSFAKSGIMKAFIPSSVISVAKDSFLESDVDTVIVAPKTAPADLAYMGYYKNQLTAPVVYVPDTWSYREWRPKVSPIACGAEGDIYYSDGITPPKLTLMSLIPGYVLSCDFESPYSVPGIYTVSVPVRFFGPRDFETEVSYSYEIKDTALSLDSIDSDSLCI